jgi:hypothetical protein
MVYWSLCNIQVLAQGQRTVLGSLVRILSCRPHLFASATRCNRMKLKSFWTLSALVFCTHILNLLCVCDGCSCGQANFGRNARGRLFVDAPNITSPSRPTPPPLLLLSFSSPSPLLLLSFSSPSPLLLSPPLNHLPIPITPPSISASVPHSY